MKLAIVCASAAILITAFAFARANAYDEEDGQGPIDPNATSFTMFEDEYFGPFDVPPRSPHTRASNASTALVEEDHDAISITVTKFKRPDSEGPEADLVPHATSDRKVR